MQYLIILACLEFILIIYLIFIAFRLKLSNNKLKNNAIICNEIASNLLKKLKKIKGFKMLDTHQFV